MPKVKVYNQEGNVVSERELNPEIFEVSAKPALIHQVAVSRLANQRQALAHTKTRGEVRGGGRKPWRQKGTGRARVGSIRSPLWRGGGIVFGPRKTRVFSKKINKKMKRLAVLSMLSDKVKNNTFFLLERLELPEAKTKNMAKILNNLKLKNVLIIVPKDNQPIIRASRNIPNVTVIGTNNLSLIDLLKHKYLLITLEGLGEIERIYS